MVIEPLKKKNGKPYTNVEINNMCYEKLCRLRDGVGCKTEKEKRNSKLTFYKICGGSDNAEKVMSFMKQIHDEKDERAAQELFQDCLLPIFDIGGIKL